MTKIIDIEKLSLIVRIKNLPEDTQQYIQDISTLLNTIPTRLEHLEFEPAEELIRSADLVESHEVSQSDLPTKEGQYFVSKRSVG